MASDPWSTPGFRPVVNAMSIVAAAAEEHTMGDDNERVQADTPTEMMQGALALREMFQTYIAAGFSEYQTCVLLGTMIAQGARGGTETNE